MIIETRIPRLQSCGVSRVYEEREFDLLMPLTRKALNYDLDDFLLRKYYPNPNSYKYAWTLVKKFLYERGFEDRQYSGVISSKPMLQAIVQTILKQMCEEYKWFAPCVQKFDVTNITAEYDMRYIFTNNYK